MSRPTTLIREPLTSASRDLPRRLRVASVCTVFPSRALPHHGIFVKRRLDGLADFAEVRVLRPVPWFPGLRGRRTVCRDADSNGLPVYERRMFYLPGVLQQTTAWWLQRAIAPTLAEWARTDALDLIDAHFGYPEGVGSWAAARRLDVPLFVTVRGNEAWYIRRPGFRQQLLAALQGATGIVAVSHSLRELLIGAGVDGEKITVIPNGLTTDVFHPGPQAEARAALGLPADRRFIISVGRLEPRKGCEALIRAFQNACRRHDDIELLFVGGAEGHARYAQALKRQVAAEQIEGRVHFVGPQRPARVADWLRASDVFAQPSRREGCCNAVLEALACGLPVVTTAVGDNARYVSPDRNGYAVDPEHDDALGDALSEALSRAWDNARIAREACGADWRSVGRAVNGFFQECLGR